MDRQLQYMRDQKLLKDRGSHEEYEDCWIEEGQFAAWSKQSAVPPKKKPVSPAKKHFPRQIQATHCTHDQCEGSVYKSGLCQFHWTERHREKNRIYRAKRRAVLKTAKAAETPRQKPTMRFCSECGKPALESATSLLCREHYNIKQRNKRRRMTEETDAIRESQAAAKKSLLERLWTKKLAEYDSEKEA